MADFPFMNTKTAELLADTTHLSPAEFGAYWRLIIAMWRNGAYLPADEAKLRRYSTLDGRSWARSRETILAFFEVHDEGIVTQKTLTIAYNEAAKRSGKATDSALARWEKVRRNADRLGRKDGGKVAKRLRHGNVTQTRERAREHDHSSPKPLENNEPGHANAMRTHRRSNANYKPLTINHSDDDDDPRAHAREIQDDDIPFGDLEDGGDDMLQKVSDLAGIVLGKETDPSGTVESWKSLELSDDEILETIVAVRTRKGGDPPKRLAYFEESMQARARLKRREILKPVKGRRDHGTDEKRKLTARERRAEAELEKDLELARDLGRKRG